MALIETVGTRQLVVYASDRCKSTGVREGMTLAEARSLCLGLQHFPHAPRQDQQALNALGRWLMRFSPVVSPWPPDAVLVDVGGCERLFGGMEALLNRAAVALAALKVQARLAIAPTPAAAWAMASYGASGSIVPADALAESLAPLPPSALRIDSPTVLMLKQLGIETIGQLMDLPRQMLPARFGVELLRRLDAALGRAADPLIPLEYHAQIKAAIEFEAEIDSLETIWQALRELLGDLVRQLSQRGSGVRLLRMRLRRMYDPPIEKTIRLSRPTRKSATLFNLLRLAYEAARSDAGFTGIQLQATAVERISDEQLLLQEHEQQAACDELDRLIETLHARLGPRIIVQPQLVESHLPELAYRLIEAPSAKATAITPALLRPLRLLRLPVAVTAMASPSHRPVSFTHQGSVHRLAYCGGPERISGMWWEGRDKTRDYFEVENEDGLRFWLFRVVQTGHWYLHGQFA